MSASQVNRVVKLYQSIAQYPALSSAKITWLGESGLIVQSRWSQRNLERTTTQKFAIDHTLTSDFKIVSESFPIDVSSELLSKTTEDGQLKAVLRSVSGKEKESSKQFIEIWSKQNLLKNYDLSALDVHGDVYTDVEFGTFEWSQDSSKLLYIAEKKLPKSEPFYKQKAQEKKSEGTPEKDEIVKGNEYIFKPDWGEQLVGKHRSVIAILDTKADEITVATDMPEELSPAQLVWAPDSSVVGVAWTHEPRQLGLKFCTNRESWVFQLKNGEFRKISANNCAVRSPRFSNDGKHLVWLERNLSGPHHNAHRLMHQNWLTPDQPAEILIDVVRRSITINNGKLFYGLYNREFPCQCWSNDGKYLFFSTPQRSNVRSYALNIETKVLTEIEHDSRTLMILTVKNDILLLLRTSLLEPAHLLISKFDSNRLSTLELTHVTTPIKINDFENLEYNIIYEMIEHEYDNNEEIKEFNFMYFGPEEDAKNTRPLIVMVHGGPHSAYCNSFSLEATLLVLSGFGLVLVNYRGSIGMGADNVEYLQGRVGVTDVQDCVTATREVLNRFPCLDPARVGLNGGSHGGFLVGHLSGQYAGMYQAVVTRNPVIDIAVMFKVSDIPDCRNALFKDEHMALRHDVLCAAVIHEPYSTAKLDIPDIPPEEMMRRMFNCSPIVHVEKVTAPTLVCIGKNDLRVPPSQGMHWYYRLKANKCTTKLLVYDDNHQLGSATAEIDEIINSILWMMQYLRVD